MHLVKAVPETNPRDLHRRRVSTQQQIHEVRQLLLEAADRLVELDLVLREGALPTEADGLQPLGQAGALTAAAQYRIRKVREQLGAPVTDHPSIWAKAER